MKKTMVAAAAVFTSRRDPRLASPRPVLPDGLAPAQVERVERLLSEVATTSAPPITIDLSYLGPRCIVCFGGGKLGGHHDDAGQLQWIHRTCHRRLHRRGWIRRSKVNRLMRGSGPRR